MHYKSFLAGALASTLLIPSLPAYAAVADARGFKVDAGYYPTRVSPNLLPNGTLIKQAGTSDIYYVQNGLRSLVVANILNRWFGENHFYKSDIALTLPPAEFNKYHPTGAVNPIYVGKVLQHPNGTQFYIDDKLRKRELTPAVRAKLRFPAANLYPTTDTHLKQFKTGPKLTGDLEPGGMIIYDGPFHGGRIWKLEEGAGGKIMKRLYEYDHFYEAAGNPDESERVSVSAAELAKYPRGNNISQFPDGWLVGKGTTIYLVENGSLRQIASPTIFATMGYRPQLVQTSFPQFIVTYGRGVPVAAFKSLVDKAAIAAAPPASAPANAADGLVNVRPAVRAVIAQINNLGQTAYDRELTGAENKFWVNYVYSGEVNTADALSREMRRTHASGVFPPLTSRTATIDLNQLKSKWFPYLFYFVWHKEPTDDDQSYWFGRIHSGDRDTIEKLGGTIEWLKETSGLTHK